MGERQKPGGEQEGLSRLSNLTDVAGNNGQKRRTVVKERAQRKTSVLPVWSPVRKDPRH